MERETPSLVIQSETKDLNPSTSALPTFQYLLTTVIANVFKEGELDKESNMQILHNTLSKYKPTAVYNLDVIISVGYRVKSQRGVKFRQWANNVLKQYLVILTTYANTLFLRKFG